MNRRSRVKWVLVAASLAIVFAAAGCARLEGELIKADDGAGYYATYIAPDGVFEARFPATGSQDFRDATWRTNDDSCIWWQVHEGTGSVFWRYGLLGVQRVSCPDRPVPTSDAVAWARDNMDDLESGFAEGFALEEREIVSDSEFVVAGMPGWLRVSQFDDGSNYGVAFAIARLDDGGVMVFLVSPAATLVGPPPYSDWSGWSKFEALARSIELQ